MNMMSSIRTRIKSRRRQEMGDNHDVEILHRFMMQQQQQQQDDLLPTSLSKIDLEAEPVNICILDGGGMKGYAHPVILQYIQEKCEDKGNLRNRFHLFAGTSVGGVAALLLHKHLTIADFKVAATQLLDNIRETSTFSDKKGTVKQSNTIETVTRDRFGSEDLYCPEDIPALVVCAARESGKKDIQPFVFRTYDHKSGSADESYPKSDDVTTRSDKKPQALTDGSNSASLAEAMAATTAIPGVCRPIKKKLNGKATEFAEGGIFCESPVAIAISEARQLYPNRPIGVIISIGLNAKEDDHIRCAIDIAKCSHPNLYYHRIVPREILDTFSSTEEDPTNVVAFEKNLRRFLEKDIATNTCLDKTIDKIFASKSNKCIRENSSFPFTPIVPRNFVNGDNTSNHGQKTKCYDLSGEEGNLDMSSRNSVSSDCASFSRTNSQNMIHDLHGWHGY